MDRFGASMAKLASQPTTTTTTAKAGGENADAHGEVEDKGQDEAPQTSSRWAALRGYISATMEQNPTFVTR